MFSKLGIAAAIIAVGTFAGIDDAAAKRGDKGKRADGAASSDVVKKRGKKKNGGKRNRAEKVVTRAAPLDPAPAPRVRKKKKKKGWKKFARVVRKVAKAYVASQHHRDHVHYDVRPRRDRWSNAPRRFRDRDFDRRCVAVAKTRRGTGRRIHSTREVGFGRRACRKAMRRCDDRLYERQMRGRNPRAACVIVNRG